LRQAYDYWQDQPGNYQKGELARRVPLGELTAIITESLIVCSTSV